MAFTDFTAEIAENAEIWYLFLRDLCDLRGKTKIQMFVLDKYVVEKDNM